MKEVLPMLEQAIDYADESLRIAREAKAELAAKQKAISKKAKAVLDKYPLL